MRIRRLGLCCLLALGVLAPESRAEEKQAKPDFALRDVDGVVRRLADYRGKWVVLEWVNFACDPVKTQYQAPGRRMQALQKAWMAKGVVWLSINSSGVGQSGHLAPKQCKEALARLGAKPTAFLLDPDGKVGKAFRAQVTPELRVLSPKGDIVYAGGLESAGPGTPVRYLETVLTAATSGRAIPYAAQSARGCRIPYAGGTPATGPKAPDFVLIDSRGMPRRLSDFRGKWVVLEWINLDCPYVKKQYHTSHRSMQKLQARAARLGMVWLCICSSAPGKEGYHSSAQVNARLQRLGATPAAYLHDPTGQVGRTYGAQTTPDMRIISPQGTIEYSGGIDNIKSMRASDVAKARNYVRMAFAAIAAGKPIATKRSRPYGCTVKY